jgi:hypothetical protein
MGRETPFTKIDKNRTMIYGLRSIHEYATLLQPVGANLMWRAMKEKTIRSRISPLAAASPAVMIDRSDYPVGYSRTTRGRRYPQRRPERHRHDHATQLGQHPTGCGCHHYPFHQPPRVGMLTVPPRTGVSNGVLGCPPTPPVGASDGHRHIYYTRNVMNTVCPMPCHPAWRREPTVEGHQANPVPVLRSMNSRDRIPDIGCGVGTRGRHPQPMRLRNVVVSMTVLAERI